MHEQASKWVDLFERVVNILRPKAYNAIARWVISIGLIQIAESQVKIAHALVIALFEEYIGKSEVLQSFLRSTSDPTVGIILVLSGLAYHLIVTLGKDYIDTRKAELPKFPILSCLLLNGDKEELDLEFIIRGSRVNLPHKDDIPDHKEQVPDYEHAIFGDMHRMASMHNSMLGKRKNTELFRERAKVLFQWAGTELLYLNITNNSSVLASGVSIKLKIPRHKGLSVTMPGQMPDIPKEEIEDFTHLIPHHITCAPVDLNAISVDSDSRFYHVSWSVSKMQAKTEDTSTNCILLKTDKLVEIECTIFCNELPEPITSKYTVHPTLETVDINIEELIDSDLYNEMSDKLIMDGYQTRLFRSWYAQYEMDEYS
ncbi:TPA: hypothetical protein ACGU7E_003772 [Vibrio vulnificus]